MYHFCTTFENTWHIMDGFQIFSCSHAQQFMEYQAQRGGTLELLPIQKPTIGKIELPITAMERALEQEHELYTHLQEMNRLAEEAGDAHLSDFLVDFLKHQV